MQETHCGATNNRLKVRSMTLAVKRSHSKYENAIFLKTGTIIERAFVTDDGKVEVLELKLKAVTVVSIYKPPVNAFCMHTANFQTASSNWGL